MKKIAMIAFAIGTLAVQAQAVTLFEIVSFNTDTTGPTTQSVDALISSVAVYSRGAGVEFNAGGTFNSKGWDDGTSAATAVAAGNTNSWGFTSAAVDLTNFSFRYDRSNTGPAQGVIQLSVNGGAFVDVFSDSDINAAGEENLLIDLSSFDNVTSATFRFAGWGASSAAGTFDWENTANINGASFQLTGEAAQAVPEPATMIALAAAGLAAASRRKKN